MNRTYGLVWNESQGAWTAVPESARRHGKGGGGRSLAGLILFLAAWQVNALPTGGQISAGQGAIGQGAHAVTVTQRSQRMAINWQSFSIGESESVTFAQPNASAIVLNRVLGSDPSQIFGRLSANGQVWLLNPNGVLFGAGAQVNVGGLLASTLTLSDADFLAGKRSFRGTGGSVVNRGSIGTTDGGYVALLGGKVSNEGVIQARLGTVALAAGRLVTLDFAGDRLLSLQVDQGAVDALVQNEQLIRADGGTVLMSAKAADALIGSVVNNTGIVEARRIDTHGGTIRLVGDGAVTVAGRLDAAAPDGGNGGFIETSGARVQVSDGATITTAAASGTTGTWLVNSGDFNIAACGGDISGTALGRSLNRNNVTIRSGNGAGAAGDVEVNDAVTWSSANSLTLSALHGIDVGQALRNDGRGGVTLRADNTGACVAGAAACGTVAFSGAGHVAVNGGAVNIYYNPTGSNQAADANGNGPTYATPTDYLSRITLNGGSALNAWMLVNDINQLQAIRTNLAGNYALGRDIDASATAGWNGGAGFVPVGDPSAPFSGHLDGGGHVIDSLSINRPTTNFVGVFGVSSGRIANVGLSDIGIRGNDSVGGVVGKGVSDIDNSYAIGRVSGSSGVGGLVGDVTGLGYSAHDGGLISNSHFEGNVSGSTSVGGVVGAGIYHLISDSYAMGQVTGTRYVGGLIGNTARLTVTNSHFEGSVKGADYVGGLMGGTGFTTVIGSYAKGEVSGKFDVGGLIGSSYFSRIESGHIRGRVSGDTNVGGLMGINFGSAVIDSDASARVCGAYNVGGLVGYNYGGRVEYRLGGGLVANSRFKGSVDGGSNVGGLVGNSGESAVTDSYATGTVSGRSNVGGLVGYNDVGADIKHSRATVVVTGSRDVGGLVGTNRGTIDHGRARGKVAWDGASVGERFYVGGLVGVNAQGTIRDSSASGNVEGGLGTAGGLVGGNLGGSITGSHATGEVQARFTAGGLVGYNDANGTIADSYAKGNVFGRMGDGGGLVAYNEGSIRNAFATGRVNSQEDSSYSGGLVAINTRTGTIVNAFASGDVVSFATAGGLVGQNLGSLKNVVAFGNVQAYRGPAGGLVADNGGSVEVGYATGNVTGSRRYNGGLVGINNGTLREVFATGAVIGKSFGGGASGLYNGGLVGYNAGSIDNAYATGAVTANSAEPALYNGGLVGYNAGIVRYAYATGAVSGAVNNGGLAGGNSGSIVDSYWDMTTSRLTTSAGGTGLTDRQMRQRKSFVGFDFEHVWIITDHAYPTLRAFLKSGWKGGRREDGQDEHRAWAL